MRKNVSPAPTIYTDIEPSKRPKSDTPLSLWLKAHEISAWALAREVGCTPVAMDSLKFGRSMPSLVTAFKIERATSGGVPVSSWLGTDLGRTLWRKTTSGMWK